MGHTLKQMVKPLAVQVRSWLTKVLPYRPDLATRTEWEQQYARGRWDYLRGTGELARYSIIAGYCCYFKPSGAILDIGCGEGILKERLHPHAYSYYTGIDISAEAIKTALGRRDDKSTFIPADANTYIPQRAFDIIVFNECLYHFENPLSLMQRYEPFLNDDGLYIASIVSHDKTLSIWKIVESCYLPEDAVEISHMSGLAWRIKVYRLKHRKV
jgi:2-polyprenyl-3-methyl-5-hydroxy-6-metoxy-1,4-benzoquinol methylase